MAERRHDVLKQADEVLPKWKHLVKPTQKGLDLQYRPRWYAIKEKKEFLKTPMNVWKQKENFISPEKAKN